MARKRYLWGSEFGKKAWNVGVVDTKKGQCYIPAVRWRACDEARGPYMTNLG